MRTLIGIAIGLVAFVLVAMAGIAWWLLRPEALEDYVLVPLKEQTGVEVQIGKVGLGWDGVALDDVAVFAPKTSATSSGKPVVQVSRLSVRPEWEPLLDGRVVISSVSLRGVDVDYRRGRDGRSAFADLVEALSPKDEAEASEPATEEPAGAPALELDHVTIRNGTFAYLDEFERPTNPLRLTVRLDLLRLEIGLAPTPLAFHARGEVELGRETKSALQAAGTIQPSPLTIDTSITLAEVNVDTLVRDCENPDDPSVPGPLPLDGIEVTGKVHADRVIYENFTFTDADAVAALHGTQLSVSSTRAQVANGTIEASAEVDFGVQGFRYSGKAKLQKVHLARAGGLLAPIDWGRHPDPIASLDVRLRMAGTRKKRLLDTIDLRAKGDVDGIDLDALTGRHTAGEPRDVGPFDTGRGSVSVDVRAAELRADPYTFSDAHVVAQLSNSQLDVSHLETKLAEGTLSVATKVDLTRPGLDYEGTVSLVDAQFEPLTHPIATPKWGTRSGVVGFHTELRGHGTKPETYSKNLHADGSVSWTHGRVSHSEYLIELSDLTGIPGFRDLVVEDSGGAFEVRDGTLSTKRVRIWGPDAGIQAAGSITWEGKIDAEIALGIGPNSNRELFSTGIALPYVRGREGWRFVPVHVKGTVDDPSMSLPPKAVLQSALTTVPSAGLDVVTTGLDVVRGGARAVVQGTRSLLPGVEPADEEPQATPGRRSGPLRGLVRDGADALGSAIGEMFGADSDEEAADAEGAQP